MKKRFASAGLAAGLLAGGGAGVALGVTSISSATSSPSVNVVDETATTDPAVTTDPAATDPATTATDDTTGDDAPADRPDRGAFLQETLQPLVDDGTITQAQADAVIAALEAARPEGGRGMGPGGPGMGHGRGGHGLEAAATALGITADELRTAIEGGQTIAEVATEKGVDVQTVIDAMVAELKAHLDAEVAAGEHTQEEADAKLADAVERITEHVNGTQGS
jgi:hypothetical protein